MWGYSILLSQALGNEQDEFPNSVRPPRETECHTIQIVLTI